MSKIELLRVFLNQRLTMAAEEIFGVVEETIAGYQEENSRLRSMLDVVIKPDILLHRIDIQQPTHPVSEQEVLPEQQHCEQEWSPSLGQEDPHYIQIKEEPEELESSLKNDSNHQDLTQSSLLYETQSEDYEETYCLPSTSTAQRNYSLHSTLTEQSSYSLPSTSTEQRNYSLPSTSTAQRNYSLPSTLTEQNMIQIKPELNAEDNGVSEPSRESQPLFTEDTESSAAQSKNMKCVKGVESRPLSGSKPLKSKRSQTVRKQSAYIHCKFCGMYFSYLASLVNHARKHAHDKECLCGVCGIHLDSTESMLDHLETHVGARVCHVCGTFFPGSAELNDHMKVHPGEKSFRCPDCGKCFRKNPDLTAHKRIHTGERPYRCQFCGKGFSQSGNLAVHMKSHSGEKPHCCPVCGKCFSSKSYMNTHMKIHTGERPFCCRLCGKCFIRNPDLTVHMRTHTGVKPYKCQYCGQGFKQNYHRKLHMKIHMGKPTSLPSL
uniref:zinc finger protein 37-like n=1 Tax=Oncorhynchus gorbuscha TaxID=8017 RepID=UPI001EAE9487|nr:zinc finger protein 37-like [Oncorhynchus gorbuscha]